MKYGIDMICFLSEPQQWDFEFYVHCGRLAEEAGWDGFFIWDHIWGYWDGPLRTVDPWIILSAVAVSTKTITLGPMVTPLARRRPWKLARETVSLDHLSKGRLVLGVGLGGTTEEFALFGEDSTAKVRAQKLDESLAILLGFWTGKPFAFTGLHYYIQEVTFLPSPFQKPRIPIWVAGYHPNIAPFRRAARYEGVFPMAAFGQPFGPAELRDVIYVIRAERESLHDYEVVVAGSTLRSTRREEQEIIGAWQQAGATWWLEHITDWFGSKAELVARIQRGPPELAS